MSIFSLTLLFNFYTLVLFPVFIALLAFYQFQISWRLTSFANLPGPERDSLIWGNMKSLFKAQPGDGHEAFVLKHGPTLRYTSMFGMQRFYTCDPRAIAHILNSGYDYPKPKRVREAFKAVIGEGLIASEGEAHRRQRKIMLPAFAQGQIRDIVPAFFTHSYELRDKVLELLIDGGDFKTKEIDILHWVNRATLDIIGDTGFNYSFNALKGETNELAEAFHNVWIAGGTMNMLTVLQSFFPIFKLIPTSQTIMARTALSTMERIGAELVEREKAQIQASLEIDNMNAQDGEVKHSMGRKGIVGKDLLANMIRSNMADDVPESQRMTNAEVIGQITTFMVAGQETSATATGWALYAMANDPVIQEKLREELWTVQSEEPVLEELSALPYLDCVVRETLRMYSPVPSTHRIAAKDDVLPLSAPITNTRNGKPITEIKIKAGDSVFIPVLNLNTMTNLWGPDSKTFRPERWQEALPSSVKDIPGVWGNQTTFLQGTRSCIGYRYALAEVKALLFVLIRNFIFTHTSPKPEFEKKTSFLILRPNIKGNNSGPTLPLMIAPYNRL